MIKIIFDGPPAPESGRFVEVENALGESIKCGTWVESGEFWELHIDHIPNDIFFQERDSLRKELAEAKGEVELNKQEKRFICDPRPNLLHFRWARGNYSNKCGVCAVIFTGDKLAGMCADCAWEKEAKRAEKAEAERDELAKRLATYACFGEKEAT